jgi:hypothetical protein
LGVIRAEEGKSAMIYVKSILVGLLAVFLFVIIWLVVFSISVSRGLPPDQAIGIDVVSLAKQWKSQLIMLFVFAAGFYWEFKRASK